MADEVKPRPIEDAIAEFPLSDDAKARLVRFFRHPKDYLCREVEGAEDRLPEEGELPRLSANRCRAGR